MTCTSVLQLTDIPEQPEECEGVVKLFNVRNMGQLSKKASQAADALKAWSDPSPKEAEAIIYHLLNAVRKGAACCIAKESDPAGNARAPIDIDFSARAVSWQFESTEPDKMGERFGHCTLRFAKHMDAVALVDTLRKSACPTTDVHEPPPRALCKLISTSHALLRSTSRG